MAWHCLFCKLGFMTLTYLNSSCFHFGLEKVLEKAYHSFKSKYFTKKTWSNWFCSWSCKIVQSIGFYKDFKDKLHGQNYITFKPIHCTICSYCMISICINKLLGFSLLLLLFLVVLFCFCFVLFFGGRYRYENVPMILDYFIHVFFFFFFLTLAKFRLNTI